MDEALTIHRLHFAFTITYHYLFPQLTMGLALLLLTQNETSMGRADVRAKQAFFLAEAGLDGESQAQAIREYIEALA